MLMTQEERMRETQRWSMEQREAAKRENLRENGRILRQELVKLIELIDRGEWEQFQIRRGEIKSSGDVDVVVGAVQSEIRRRDMILTHAKYQLGGYAG